MRLIEKTAESKEGKKVAYSYQLAETLDEAIKIENGPEKVLAGYLYAKSVAENRKALATLKGPTIPKGLLAKLTPEKLAKLEALLKEM